MEIYKIKISPLEKKNHILYENIAEYTSREKALEDAIKYAMEHLIRKYEVRIYRQIKPSDKEWDLILFYEDLI